MLDIAVDCEFESFKALLNVFRARDAVLYFVPGKYGRVDLFYLQSPRRHADVDRHVFGYLHTQPGDETLAALRQLDMLLENGSDSFCIVCTNPPRGIGVCWFDVDYKRDFTAAQIKSMKSAPRYERRLAEQTRILAGEIKRGHKDFGLFPLEGGR